MSSLIIKQELCVGCGKCVRVCPVNALTLKGKKAFVGEACVMCGQCVESCPANAIAMPAKEDVAVQASDNSIWVIAELFNGQGIHVSYELTSEAAKLANAKQSDVTVIVIGDIKKESAEMFVAHGADHVLVVGELALNKTSYTTLNELETVEAIYKLIKERQPDAVLIGATGYGRSIAPRIAAKLKTGLTADCTVLSMDEEKGYLVQTRPAFGGNLMASIVCPNNRPQMATVRPGVMPAEIDENHQGSIEIVTMEIASDKRIKVLEEVIAPKAASISDAKIIVTAGRGVSSVKELKVIREFAECIGAELGVTRPLVDMGWEDSHRQIGQTGATVSPDLLITFGVSGAIQHLAGMMQAKNIIAVNTDPDAPIFKIAHYCVNDECLKVAGALKSIFEDTN